jgi:hypothetical protein
LNNISIRTVHVFCILASGPVCMSGPSYPYWFPNFNRKTHTYIQTLKTHTRTHTHCISRIFSLCHSYLFTYFRFVSPAVVFVICTSNTWPSLMLVDKIVSVNVSSASALAFFSQLLFEQCFIFVFIYHRSYIT